MGNRAIVKNRRMCVRNRRIVTSANGAPCVCGPGSNPDFPCDAGPPPCHYVITSGFSVNTTCLATLLFPPFPGGEPTLAVTYRAVAAFGLNGRWAQVNGFGDPDRRGPILLLKQEFNNVGFPQTLAVELDQPLAGIVCWEDVWHAGTVRITWNIGLPGWEVETLPDRPYRFGETQTTIPQQPGCVENGAGFPFGPTINPGVATVVGSPQPCAPDHERHIAVACNGDGEQVVFDGAAYPDTTPAPITLQRLTDGKLFVPTSERTDDPATPDLEWTTQECAEPTYPVLVSCDGSQTITYDPFANPKPGGALTALYNGERFTETPDSSSTPPVPVVWSEDPCPVVGEVWQRCSSGSIGGGNAATRVRVVNPPSGDVRARRTVVFTRPCTPTGNRFVAWRVWYQRVPEDGGNYLTISNFNGTDTRPCGSLNDSEIFQGPCSDSNPQSPGDPVDPNPAAAAPASYNPQQSQIDHFGCSGCGG